MVNEARTYALWVEGFSATGERGTAKFLGTYTADTLDDAVKKWNSRKNFDRRFGALVQCNGFWTVWGCRIFDNEHAAREAFG